METIAAVARAASQGERPLQAAQLSGSMNMDGEEMAFLGAAGDGAMVEGVAGSGHGGHGGLRRRAVAFFPRIAAAGLALAACCAISLLALGRQEPARRRSPAGGAPSSGGGLHFLEMDEEGFHNDANAYRDSDWQLFDQSCAGTFKNVDYENTKVISKLTGVMQQKLCLSKCLLDEFCAVWSWVELPGVQGLTHNCILQAARRGLAVKPRRRYGVVSGLRAGVDCDGSGDGGLEGAASGAGKPMGTITNRQGLCLGASGSPAAGGGEIMEMSACAASGHEGPGSQTWTYYVSTGLMKNQHGACLASAKLQEPFSGLLTTHCNQNNWTQQWSYDPSGILKNWRGLCLAVEENRVGGTVCTQPCDVSDESQIWLLGDAPGEEKKEVATTPPPDYDPGTLFCFALMVPHTYEQQLLAWQFKANVSLFACEAYTVYSNATIWVTRGLTTSVVDSNLTCRKGGEFGTVLNLHIFLTIWTQVVREGLYLEHDWTVKVDPDAVFFPARLRGILRSYKEGGNGVYLNNCKFGLHGPVEVLSRRAVQAWSQGWPWCQAHFRERCNGDCFWGEDMFMDQCLSKILGVTRENDFRLLLEDHCDAPKHWQTCSDSSKAAFHPFKSLAGYQRCLAGGQESSGGKAPAGVAARPARPSPSSSSPPPSSASTSSSSKSAAASTSASASKAMTTTTTLEATTTTRRATTTTPEIALR